MISSLPFEPGSILHDYQYYSLFYGEPFLFGDYIYYFDGRDARITGYNRNGECITKSELNDLVDSLIHNYKVRSITLECPSLINRKFKRKCNWEIVDRPNINYDFEILIEKDKFDLKKIKRDVLRFNIEKFVVTKSTKHLSFHHLRLIETFVRQWENNVFYRSEFLSSIYYLSNRENSLIIDCYYEGKLVGFTIIGSVSKLGLMHYVITQNEINGVSDILYFTAISQLFEYGMSAVSLGFSLNKGLFFFKNKWCGSKHWRGSFELGLYLSSNAPRYMWATRLVKSL